MTFMNPSAVYSLECEFTYPLAESYVLSDFEATIDDRVIVTKIAPKEQAQERYDDATAAGHAIVLTEHNFKD